MKPAAPMPAWLKWACQIAGALLILAGLAGLTFTGIKGWTLWQSAHAKHAALAAEFTSKVVAVMLVQFTAEMIALFVGSVLLKLPANNTGRSAEEPLARGPMAEPSPVPAPRPVRRAAIKRWHSSNVLELGASFRQLWTFGAGKNGFSLDQELTLPVDGPLPARLVARDWRALFQPKLNIALLPVEQVFLRVIQLPVSEFDETLSMVELQLEKLSPLPVTQVVWSVQVLPHTIDNLQTIVVIMAARDRVEEFLGRLEGQGYLPDRLELPILDQLLATPITGDGAWIYPVPTDASYNALVAWWYGGVLRHLGLVNVPAGDNSADLLKEQMTQMAWAGELEGWLAGSPNWHLVADENTAAAWQPMFRVWLGQPAEVIAPLSPVELAALTANRAARAGTGASLLPEEYLTCYRRQFQDRLWMRGLGAVLGVYVFGVLIYIAALQIQGVKVTAIEQNAGGQYREYTNTVRLKNQLQVLEDREALKYAALDCWKVVAESLPEGFTVQSLELRNNGRSFSVHGIAPPDEGRAVIEFGDKLRKALDADGQAIFSKLESTGTHLVNNNLDWGYNGELARAEAVK